MKLNEDISRFNIVSSFSENPRYHFGVYPQGYHNAAKKLSEIFLEKSGYADYDGYPIIFLYRHAFELSLKNIIYLTARHVALTNFEIVDRALYNNHELSSLAKKCKSLLDRLELSDSERDWLQDTIRTTIRIAGEFEQIDHNSFSYRYPIDVKGNHSTSKHQVVNITSLSTSMDDLLMKLSFVSSQLHYEIDQFNDILDILYSFQESSE